MPRTLKKKEINLERLHETVVKSRISETSNPLCQLSRAYSEKKQYTTNEQDRLKFSRRGELCQISVGRRSVVGDRST